MKIVKHSGLIVEFNPAKLKSSLLKSGASTKVVDGIMKQIQAEIYEGISTKQIYKMAFALLKKLLILMLHVIILEKRSDY